MEAKKYIPLENSEISDIESMPDSPCTQAKNSHVNTRVLLWLLSLLCIILASSNTLLILKQPHKNYLPTVEPQYSGVEQTLELQPMLWTTEYSEFNSTSSDTLWKELRATHGFIALDHVWASKHGLPVAQDYRDDPSKGLYMVDAYHQLHCLILLRTSLNEVFSGLPQSSPFEHKYHCLDSLRQSVMCRADDTPLYTLGDFRSGDGQLRKCRDWKVLKRWAEDRFPFSATQL